MTEQKTNKEAEHKYTEKELNAKLKEQKQAIIKAMKQFNSDNLDKQLVIKTINENG